jgi:tetratricopeptide (TPR) repeat protein
MAHEPTPDSRKRLEEIVARFEDAWQRGEQPAIDAYLPAEQTLRLPILHELVHTDLEYGLKAGLKPRVESYLRRFPELRKDDQLVLDLIAVEWRHRLRLRERVGRAEYEQRFPQHVASLAEILDDVSSMDAEGATAADGRRPASSSQTNPPAVADKVVPREASAAEGSGAERSGTADETLDQSPKLADQPPSISSEVETDRAGEVAPTLVRKGAPLNTVRRKTAWPDIPGYRILGELGRGGMGVVYKAEQLALKRVVAMKIVLDSTLASPKKLVRFRVEAEAVAQLQHPNIVQIHEIGEYNNVPFFTLEYVDGGCLATKGEQPARRVADIVRILAQAIHAAHQRGILHRDLKPANVLLTADGSPKITDFGLAKHIGQDSGHTQTGDVMGTPSYMAPEQAAGKIKEMGVWTDVYSLGAILYELLTGRPPFKGKTFLDTLELVRTQDPVPPRHFKPNTARDLEVICLKCLEKEPAKRYASADALAEDLRRYLAGEPIVARRTTVWERAVKWGRRRPALVALIGLAVFTLVGLVAGALVFARQEYNRAENEAALRAAAELERNHAEENFSHARAAVDQMLTGVSRDNLAFEPRMEQVRRELLHKALRFYERFLVVKSDLPAVRWEAGQAYQRVGDIQELLGQHAESESAYHSAIEILGDLAARFPETAEYRHDLAAAHSNLGSLLKKAGRTSEAEQSYQQAVDLLSALARDYPESPEYRRALGASYRNRGTLRHERNRPAEADQDYRSAVAVFDSLVADYPRVPDYREELARCLNNHGIQQQTAGQTQAAEQHYVRALSLFHQLASQYPARPGYRQQEAITLSQLASLKRDISLPEAEAAYRQALALRQTLALDFPSVPTYRQELADTYMNLALIKGAGRNADADRTYLDSLKVKAQLSADFPKVPGFRRDLATSYGSWGILLQTHGRLAEAAKAYHQSLDILAKLIAEFPAEPDYKQEEASALLNLGTLQQMMNQPGEAEKCYHRALERRQQLADEFRHLPDYQQELARAYLNLGTLLQINNRFPKAEAAYRDAVAILEKLAKTYPAVPDHRHELAVSYNNLGNLLQATQRIKEAEAVWRQAVDILKRMADEMPKVPSYRQEQARTLNQLAILLASTARLPEAEAAWNQALKLQNELIEEFPDRADYRLELARSYGNLGVAQLRGKPPDRAEATFDRAIQLLEDLVKDPATSSQYWQELSIHHFNRASLLTQLGKAKDAERSWKRTEALQRALVKAFPKMLDYQASLAQTLSSRAQLLLNEDKPDEALGYFQEALALYKAALAASPEREQYRQGLVTSGLGLAEVHLKRKDHAAAAQAVEALVKIAPPKGNDPPRGAELLVRGMLLARSDPDLADAQRKEVAEKYADRAVALIRQAIAGGFQDVDHLRNAAGLAPLRARNDFQKLVEGLEAGKQEP